MTTVLTRYKSSQRKGIPIAALLVALTLVPIAFSEVPFAQAYASESQRFSRHNQYLEFSEEGENEDSGTCDYEVYDYSNQDLIDAQINQTGSLPNNQPGITIPGDEVPLSNFVQTSQSSGGGSLVNILLAGLCVVSMGVMLLMLFVRRTSDYRVITVRTIAVAFGLIAIVMWSLFDRLQTPTTLFNSESGLIIVIFCIYAGMATISYLYEEHVKKTIQNL